MSQKKGVVSFIVTIPYIHQPGRCSLHPRKLTWIPKIACLKGDPFEKPSFLVYMLDFGGVTIFITQFASPFLIDSKWLDPNHPDLRAP